MHSRIQKSSPHQRKLQKGVSLRKLTGVLSDQSCDVCVCAHVCVAGVFRFMFRISRRRFSLNALRISLFFLFFFDNCS